MLYALLRGFRQIKGRAINGTRKFSADALRMGGMQWGDFLAPIFLVGWSGAVITIDQLIFHAHERADVALLRGDMNLFRGDMKALEGELKALEGELKGEMKGLEGKIDKLEGVLVGELAAMRGDMRGELAATRAAFLSSRQDQ